MVKRKDDGTKNGHDDKAQAETEEGKPVGSDHPSSRPEDKSIQTGAGGVESGAAPVAGAAVEGGKNYLGGVKRIRKAAATGLGGVSVFAASSASADLFVGTDGDDSIGGTSGDDTIFGLAGNDTLSGGNGADFISGNDGDDSVRGNSGNDSLFGGEGNDSLFGGEGNDTIRGDQGNDLIDGGPGNNLLDGGPGDDTFVNPTPGDTIIGGSGTDTISLAGVGPVQINSNPGNSTSDTIDFLDTDGNVTGSLTFSSIENIVPCFTPGTLIATPRGECAVEALRVGDRVITRDNGLQEIRWIGQRALTGQEMRKAPHLRPVMIRAGALGRGLPLHDMLVSPQHRMLLNSERAALYFEDREVLASAKHLTGMDGVDLAAARATTYVHFMFDQHEVVLSNGAWSESFQPGAQVLDGLGDVQRDEIFELFPDLRDMQGIEGYQAARRSLKKHEARLLVG